MWFSGGINEAIVKSKAEKKVFVVFVAGPDDPSAKMDTLYNKLANKLSAMPIVAVKLDSQSDNCKFFSQIYPVIVIPSTYFIDLNGVAIEIIGGCSESETALLDKINKTVGDFTRSLSPNTSNNSNQSDDSQKQSNTSVENKKPKSVPAPQPTTSSPTTDSPKEPPSETTSNSQSETQSPSAEDKVARANHLIEAMRQKKAKEEEEKERNDEIERRKGMKEMQNAKRLREDKEAQDVIKEREREKREEKLAKERVLAQIAADREERRARQMALSEKAKTEEDSGSNSQKEETEVRQRVHDKARIQFKLPDGSTHNYIFEANDKLEIVSRYVSSNLGIRSFILSTTFPRKEFLTHDFDRTLQELSLAPSSVLLVLSKSRATSAGPVVSVPIFWQMFAYISIPFVMIWNTIMGFFGRSDSSNRDERPTTGSRAPPRRADFYNREGNIARMRDPNNDEDDNNTWNGNSTQQM